ncbi:glyoxalase, partial [Enterococcus hirae]
TSDQDAAWDFYSALFGWEKTTAMDMGEAGTYQMYGLPGGPDLGGIATRPPEMPVSAWLFYAMVDDADEAAAKIEAHGGR